MASDSFEEQAVTNLLVTVMLAIVSYSILMHIVPRNSNRSTRLSATRRLTAPQLSTRQCQRRLLLIHGKHPHRVGRVEATRWALSGRNTP